MKNMLVLISLVFLSACGSKDGKTPAEKNLFSVWSASTTINLSSASFGVGDIAFMFTENQGCVCDINITGSQSSGSASVYNCLQINTNYACTNFQDSYTYTKSQTLLTLCDVGGGCEVYQ